MCEDDPKVLEIANDRRTPRVVLTQLAESDSHSVRFAVAYNEATPKAILRRLSQDLYTCFAVAANESTPQRCLVELAEHENETIRLKVARNPSTPACALGKLARNENARIRMAVAAHLSTPRRVIAELARSRDTSIRWHGPPKNLRCCW
jgi:hypothetical protein